MHSLLKDPLIHFLLLGGCLFAVFYGRGDSGDSERPAIYISSEQLEQLTQAWRVLQGREPTDAELAELIEPTIRDEVMYREALALGLDVDDDEVRTRLIEKMQYVTQDVADPEPASEQALRAFFDASPQRFQIPETVTFEQIFFSPSQRGDTIQGDVAAALAQLNAGGGRTGLGDRTPLQDRFRDSARERIRILFGETLTSAVFSSQPDVWSGPYASDFGLHVIRLIERSEARQPSFAEARERALQLFAEDTRQRANEASYTNIRSRYDIVIDWPSGDAVEAPQ